MYHIPFRTFISTAMTDNSKSCEVFGESQTALYKRLIICLLSPSGNVLIPSGVGQLEKIIFLFRCKSIKLIYFQQKKYKFFF